MTRLSHSASNKYVECGKAYFYHYIMKYRQNEQSAALLFGTAIDKATEHYAIQVQAKKITREASKKEAHSVFNETWIEQELNGKPTKLQHCTEIVYGNNDLDLELLDKSNHEYTNKTFSIKDFDSTISSILERKDKVGFRKLSDNDKEILNFVNWECMLKKGHLMIDTFCKWFDENVEEVLATQKKIELVADDDSVIGYADLIAKLKGIDTPAVLDVKTAGRAYDADAVLTSPQLSLYVFSVKHEYDETNKAGYIVLHKNVKKNKTKICKTCGYDGSGGSHKDCPNEKQVGIIEKGKNKGEPKMERCKGEWDIKIDPEVTMQFMIDDVPELLQERVVENFEQVAAGIKAKVFPRNFSSCIKYGSIKCSFYNLCHSDSMEGLIVKKDEEK